MIVWALLLIGISTSSAVQVTFTADWAAGAGWRLRCAWTVPRGDRLQSVKMYRGGVLFKIYRPEIHASSIEEEFRPARGGTWMRLSCRDQPPAGHCDLLVTLVSPPTAPEQYTCEVSGERPKFLIVTRTLEVEPYVPSNDAAIQVRRSAGESARVMLNCTASGHPAPNLTWTVAQTKVQADFTGQAWNATTKLMHSWSTLALTAKPEPLPVACTPEQRRQSELVLGPPAEYTLEVAADAGDRVVDEFRIAVALLALLYVAR
ncbi:uncharacterized protein LOC105383226 [Plutella xylostella]|uniref:uncharacterized protein LOC105383226 n=1 Tax=Plutella xylostella TaxID=51655 RepID=UPI002033110F|nr:uncharacterized protein LOC105383226 [Plutella xylostella]